MAVAKRVGHDKRGNVVYRRTPTGEDVLVSRIETIAEPDPVTGEATYVEVEVNEREADDGLPEVARAYLQWLNEHQ